LFFLPQSTGGLPTGSDVKLKSVPPPKAMKDETTLKASALVGQLSDVVQTHTQNFLVLWV
jgi:hypothetical protein